VVAQEVLEYLGVPHDQPLKTPKELLASAARDKATAGDAPSGDTADLTTMFDEINNLPADDPLRDLAKNGSAAAGSQASVASAVESVPVTASPVAARGSSSHFANLLPAKVVAAFQASGGSTSAISESAQDDTASMHPPPAGAGSSSRSKGSVVVDAGQRVAVPSFDGSALRKVVETAAGLGLRVEPLGSGIAREQVPAAGTRVPLGTEVVVRFTR
jgi:cell division protein FtsI (penicillin-binding protein 3)